MRPGFPHVPTKDDVYEGYYIPEGSMVLANAWYELIAMLR
jgi:hypothetical protein